MRAGFVPALAGAAAQVGPKGPEPQVWALRALASLACSPGMRRPLTEAGVTSLLLAVASDERPGTEQHELALDAVASMVQARRPPRAPRSGAMQRGAPAEAPRAGRPGEQDPAVGSSCPPQTAGLTRPPPPLRTNRTRRVPHPVLIGHAARLSPGPDCRGHSASGGAACGARRGAGARPRGAAGAALRCRVPGRAVVLRRQDPRRADPAGRRRCTGRGAPGRGAPPPLSY